MLSFGGAVPVAIVPLSTGVLDLSLGSLFQKTITSNTTLSIINIPSNNVARFVLEITNGGSFITWFPGVTWNNGVAPTLSGTGKDVLGFYSTNGGVTWVGCVLGLNVF